MPFSCSALIDCNQTSVFQVMHLAVLIPCIMQSPKVYLHYEYLPLALSTYSSVSVLEVTQSLNISSVFWRLRAVSLICFQGVQNISKRGFHQHLFWERDIPPAALQLPASWPCFLLTWEVFKVELMTPGMGRMIQVSRWVFGEFDTIQPSLETGCWNCQAFELRGSTSYFSVYWFYLFWVSFSLSCWIYCFITIQSICCRKNCLRSASGTKE